MSKYAAFYGSLKKDHYNFNRFGGQTYIETMELDGYELFDLGPYPMVLKGEGKITVEIHEVSESAAAFIKRMELGAGYQEEEIVVGDKKALLYLGDSSYADEIRAKYSKVEGGNWKGTD